MQITPWFKRQFPPILDNGRLPSIIERLAGTPARLKQKVWPLEDDLLTSFEEDNWSIQEHVGHLLNLESLWLSRFSDILSGATDLTVADLSNQATYDANYNKQNIEDLVNTFSEVRTQMVNLLSNVSEADYFKSALHPRMKKPMKIIDLAYFVAEHDDHHLAIMEQLLKSFK